MDKQTLALRLHGHLAEQLDHPDLARHYSDLIWELALTWKDATPPAAKTDLFMVFAFGQRRDLNGNALPDPVVGPLLKRLLNQLADRLGCVNGYVQWEIDQAVGPPIPRGMKIVRPVLNDEDATVHYLSTFDIAANAAKEVSDPKGASVCVLGHRHHVWRCLQIVRSFGFQAWAPYDELPTVYDKESSQPWCRSPEAYTLHDLISRLRARQKKLHSSSPSGK